MLSISTPSGTRKTPNAILFTRFENYSTHFYTIGRICNTLYADAYAYAYAYASFYASYAAFFLPIFAML